MQNDIERLQKNFAEINFSQKKDFIIKLKNQLEGKHSPRHEQFLAECVQSYNEEVRARNAAAGHAPKESKPKMTDISPDAFAAALATMLSGGGKKPAEADIRGKLVGKWQRDPEDGDFYYKFNDDGTFSTNEFEGNAPGDILLGNFTVGPGGAILMQPHEQLKFTGLMFSQEGNSLIITLKDGLVFEYERV